MASIKLKLGDSIPPVSGRDQDDQPVDLAEEGSHGYLLVYFYPKAMTPGCTAQACSLRDAYADLTRNGVKVIGVSFDQTARQKKFQQKEHLPFTLIADKDRTVTKAFGVPAFMNLVPARQAYLFREGKLVWLDAHASTGRQAQEVLSTIKNLQTTPGPS